MEIIWFKRRGTLIVVYCYHDKLYIGSDTWLHLSSQDKIDPKDAETEGKNVKVKKDLGISYVCRPTSLRWRVAEVGEKIIWCQSFVAGIAGDFDKAHRLCIQLKKKATLKGITDDELMDDLRKHYEDGETDSEDEGTDTEFVVATPNHGDNSTISDFMVRVVDPEGTSVINNDRPECFGTGVDLAKEFLEVKLKAVNKRVESQVVEAIKATLYHAEENVPEIGGVLVVTVSHVDEFKKIQTHSIRYPSLKVIWDVKVESDGIHITQKSFLPIARDCLDIPFIEGLMENKKPQEEEEEEEGCPFPLPPKGHVTIRLYKNIIDPLFYRTAEYFKDDAKTNDKKKNKEGVYDLVLGYNKLKESFTIGPEAVDEKKYLNFLHQFGSSKFGKCSLTMRKTYMSYGLS